LHPALVSAGWESAKLPFWASNLTVALAGDLFAGLMADLETSVGVGIPSLRLGLPAMLDEDLGRFVPQAPEELSQLVRRHGQHVGLTRLVLAPADVLQEPEVFGELLSHSLDGGEVLGPLQRHPEVLDAAEVVADQLVQAVALLAVDRDLVAAGHQAATCSASV
jgi:hypothetical protein